MKCAFTGPRPQSLPFSCVEGDPKYNSLKIKLNKKIVALCDKGVEEFFCGMALGIDLLCGEIVAQLKKTRPNIKLHAVIPFRNQTNNWMKKDKLRYENLLKQCNTSILLHEDYKSEYYLERNRWMVDHSDIVLAVCDPKNIPFHSGTGATVRYAVKKQKPVLFVIA